MNADRDVAPVRMLAYVPGGGFQLESQLLLQQLDGVALSLILPNDSVVSPWMNDFTLHRVIALGSRANSGRWHTLRRFLRNFRQAWRILRAGRPQYLLCVGSSICVPGFMAARLQGIPTIFVESITRTDDLSGTGRLIRKFGLASRFYVQWPEQAVDDAKLVYRGAVL